MNINTSILDSASGEVPFQLKNDYLFRAVMQRNDTVLKGFICSLLHLSPKEVSSVKITNPIILGETIDAKTFILDLNIMLNDNKLINIEMQLINYKDWPERSLSYLSREFDNLSHGKNYIDVLPTHHISILDFPLFSDFPEFFSTNKMMNVKNYHIYSDKFTLSVLDLTQINIATKEDKEYRLDYWAYLFRAQTWEDIKMLAEKDDIIKQAAATMCAVSAEENIRQQCKAREENERIERSIYASGKKTGVKIGEDRLASLNSILLESHDYKSLEKATKDEAYREELYKKYNL